ncbi:hypothetical protein MMC13_004595 [Lambiella insularis]|nr:hypothetical protein [Lambiella insularis]
MLSQTPVAVITVLMGLMGLTFALYYFVKSGTTTEKIPISVNYHLTRQCNYSCGFCFHTAKTSHVESLPNAKKAMTLLKNAGMKKINFAGGEPFMNAEFLGQLVRYCKETLKLESVSVVTNASKVTEKWLTRYGEYLDIMAISCDSFDEATNIQIGRGTGTHIKTVIDLSQKCKEHGIMLKINTVVNRYNFQEDMNAAIEKIQPFRWKCFQVLIVPEENGSEQTLRDARRFLINDDEWRLFYNKHKHQGCFVPESNDVMASSYLLLDEYLRFLNKGVGKPTESILEIGVAAALKDVYWDEDGFEKRGGVYEWSKSDCSGETQKPDLDW